jgi:peptidyl-prolyl cis-trans isomerase D
MLQFLQKGFFAGFFLVILVLAAFSLILTDWTGSFRSGVGASHVAEMRGDRIAQTEFARLADRVLRAEQIDPARALEMGLIHQLASSEIWARMLYNRATQKGVMVGDDALLDTLRRMTAAMPGTEGENTATIIKRFIEAQGITEAQFLETMRRETVNNLMRTVVAGTAAVSPLVEGDVIRAERQTRDVTYAILRDADVPGIEPPTPQQLEAFYQQTIGQYQLPERRDVRLTLVPRAVLSGDTTISDQDIQAFYDDHLDEFKVPERRSLVVATFKDQEAANDVVARVKKADDLMVTAKGIKDATVAPAQDFDVTADTANPLAPAFTAPAGSVVGPIASPLGALVVGVVGSKPAKTQPISAVREKIAAQIRDDRMNAALDRRLDELNRASDQGDTLATVAKGLNVPVRELAGLDRQGETTTGADAFKDMAAIKGPILTAAFAGAEVGRMLAPLELADGQLGLIEVAAITPAAPKPLADVRDQVAAEWLSTERSRANMTAAQAMLPDLISGKIDIAGAARERQAGVDKLKGIMRDQKELPAMLDRAAWARLFDAQVGQPIFHPIPGGILLATVTAATLATPETVAKDAQESLRARIARAQQEEQIALFMGSLADYYKPQVNDRLLQAMYGRRE